MTAIPKLAIVQPALPDAEALAALSATVAEAEKALREAVYGRDAFCRQWSADNGYCVPLNVEQVRRALEYGERGSGNG